MSTTTITTSAAADQAGQAPAPAKARGRGGRGLAGTLTSHGLLVLASLIALFPIVWLVFLSLGPDKDDYLHPGASGRR
ncbi:Maltose permease OS=Streptomyces glaucescens OX=1907 GN=SGLAU_10140 PE=3 SV=1 [Streptomyces glaucescens]